jgi:hypothetical protein
MHVPLELILLVLVGLLSGIINALAGGASIILYPLFLSLGLAPIIANASTSVAVAPGTAGATFGYRKSLSKVPRTFLLLLLPCVIGGFLGAYLLGHTPNRTFERIVPWFVLLASVLIGFQPQIHAWVMKRKVRRFEKRHLPLAFLSIGLVAVLLAVYGGYFGGGFSLMLLAILGLTTLKDIRQMNALKSLLAGCMNLVAIGYLITHGLIEWRVLPPILLGNMVGGWLGATGSSRVSSRAIRHVVVAFGLTISALLFAKSLLVV